MDRCATIGLTVLLVWAMGGAASADIITIDGDRGDWEALIAADRLDSVHDDPEGDADQPYDIDQTWFVHDLSTGMNYFGLTTYGPLADYTSGNFARLNVSTVPGEGGMRSGFPNFEYYIEWDLRDSPSWGAGLTMHEWDGAFWNPVMVAPEGLALARDPYDPAGDGFFEMSISNEAFGNPDVFTFGWHLDDDGILTDDFSPDDFDQRGYVPEPTTLLLVPLGLAGLAALRRRREER